MRAEFKKTCIICGKQFEAKSNQARYCSEECKDEGRRRRWRAYDQARKEHKVQLFVQAVEKVQRRKNRCKGCVWKSWQDHKKCVMPTCLKDLGAVGERREDEAD